MPVRINEVASEITAIEAEDLLSPALIAEIARRVEALNRRRGPDATLAADRRPETSPFGRR